MGCGRVSTILAGSAPRPDPLLPERLRHVTLASSSSSSSMSSTHTCKKYRIYPLPGSQGPAPSRHFLLLIYSRPTTLQVRYCCAVDEGTGSVGLSISPWIPGRTRKSQLHTQVAEFSSSCVQPSRLHLQTTDQDGS